MRFAVVGDPVDHSRSPAMHTAGYRYLGIDATYGTLRVPADGFNEVVTRLRDGRLDGVNVTMPHKHHAFEAADVVDPEAVHLQAVNTLTVREGTIYGYNTDVDGVRLAVERLGLPTIDRVHILGSGGAAAAALVAVSNHPVFISARSMDRASELSEQVGVVAGLVPWGEAVPGAVVVNATPVGMNGEDLPAAVLADATGLVDMAYGDRTTPAVQEAARLGIAASDGLVMLAGQAAAAFEIFTGTGVPVEVLEDAGRRS